MESSSWNPLEIVTEGRPGLQSRLQKEILENVFRESCQGRTEGCHWGPPAVAFQPPFLGAPRRAHWPHFHSGTRRSSVGCQRGRWAPGTAGGGASQPGERLPRAGLAKGRRSPEAAELSRTWPEPQLPSGAVRFVLSGPGEPLPWERCPRAPGGGGADVTLDLRLSDPRSNGLPESARWMLCK